MYLPIGNDKSQSLKTNTYENVPKQPASEVNDIGKLVHYVLYLETNCGFLLLDSDNVVHSLLQQLRAQEQMLNRILSLEQTKSKLQDQRSVSVQYQPSTQQQHQPSMQQQYLPYQPPMQQQYQPPVHQQYQRRTENVHQPVEGMRHQTEGVNGPAIPDWYVSNMESLLIDNYQRGRESLDNARAENQFLSSMLKVRNWSK